MGYQAWYVCNYMYCKSLLQLPLQETVDGFDPPGSFNRQAKSLNLRPKCQWSVRRVSCRGSGCHWDCGHTSLHCWVRTSVLFHTGGHWSYKDIDIRGTGKYIPSQCGWIFEFHMPHAHSIVETWEAAIQAPEWAAKGYALISVEEGMEGVQ